MEMFKVQTCEGRNKRGAVDTKEVMTDKLIVKNKTLDTNDMDRPGEECLEKDDELVKYD